MSAPTTATSTAPSSPNWRRWPRQDRERLLQRLQERRAELRLTTDGPGERAEGAELDWREWIARYFPHVASAPFGERHVRLWDWFEALTPGVRPRPRVEIWPRGGAKSSTAELGTCRVGVKLSRRFVLYVSETQEQADKHVQAISSLFERCGIDRAVGKYGHSKGWRRDQLRTANGFNVAAFGLDVASRGVKLDQYRPDLIVLDDIDSQDDNARATEKKIRAITSAIIPTGSPDCATLAIQNLILEDGIFDQLLKGTADFLRDREPAGFEPAVTGLETELVDRGDGLQVYRITGGAPTWAGQGLDTCEKQINDWGLAAFLREAQHEVSGASGYFFDTGRITVVDPTDVPPGLRLCRAWDLAATHGGGDWTAGPLVAMRGRLPDVQVWVLEFERGQWGSDEVRRRVKTCQQSDPPGTALRLPQDPGQAGKDQAQQFRSLFPGAIVKPVTGDKATRATGLQEALNRGNVYFVRGDWNHPVREVLRKFRADVSDQQDDEVDALADAFNQLAGIGGPAEFITL